MFPIRYYDYKKMQLENDKKEIEQACISGYAESLKSILNEIYDFPSSTYYNHSYLRIAYSNNYKDIISILLKAGASPDTSYIGDNPLLYDACLEGKEEIVDIFLNAGANPNIKKRRSNSLKNSSL